jgi:hypothetical protein
MAEVAQAVQYPAPEPGKPIEYDAFLSYAHRDKEVTTAIQKGLHRIGRRVGQLRALRVFRDDTNLSANPDWWGKVTAALDSSRFMIVALSPQSAASHWVNKEVSYWLQHRGHEQLMLALAEGHLQWDPKKARFDPALSDAAPPVLTEPGSLPAEPLHIDVSGDRPWDLRLPTFRDKVTALAAPIHGKPKDELAGDDVREQRRFRRLRSAAITALIMLIVIGLTTSTTVNSRQRALTTVRDHSEPLSFAAGRLYTGLSVADAAAATAFIAQAEPRGVRLRYEQAITDAAVAVTRASSGLTDQPLVELLGRINAELAVYTGLIEVARTNNREGNPVGSNYLSEASGLMQSTILPDAQRLYQATSAQVDAQTTASARIPVVVALIVAVTVLCGLYSMHWWARRSRRRLNVGFLAGGLAVLIMMIWVSAALGLCIADSRSAKSPGDSLKTMTTLAISAQQARADETLSLIRRGEEEIRKQSFYQRIDTMHQQLDQYMARPDAVDKADLQGADRLLVNWRLANDRINSYISVGNYRAATEVALGSSEDDSTPAFDKLDESLVKVMDQSRTHLRNDSLDAPRWLSGATVGTVVLSFIAAVAVIAGLWPRMNE